MPSRGKPARLTMRRRSRRKLPAGECCKAGDTTPPVDLVKQVPIGGLHSPYQDYAKLAKEEELVKNFRLPGCNECHGGNGGGGMCPALNSRHLVLGQHR